MVRIVVFLLASLCHQSSVLNSLCRGFCHPRRHIQPSLQVLGHEGRRHYSSSRLLVHYYDYYFVSTYFQVWPIINLLLSIIIPWVCVRRVEINIELPSSKAAVIRFKGGMQQGLLARISRSPLLEYHAFGIIS
jgi:hypothetical protein